MNAKIFITGAAGSGKSPFARLLAAELALQSGRPWPIAECSDGLIRRAAHIQAHAPWPQAASQEDWSRYIRARKAEYRAMLLAIGDQLNADAPGKLVIEALDNADIVVGMRRQAEAKAAKAELRVKHLVSNGPPSFLIWVEAPVPAPASADRIDAEYFQKSANYSVVMIDGKAEQAARDIAADILKRS